jgi:hypothetical protein
VGSEQAETYLRLVAEKQLRRAPGRPGGRPPDIGTSMQEMIKTSRILVAAGACDDEFAAQLGAELRAALTVRSRTHLARHAAQSQMFEPFPRPVPVQASPPQPMRVTPIGRTLRVSNDRAPCDLHLMTLVSTPAEATITAVIRMHWPADGSSADLEITGAGYHHLPYDQLWAADDQGTRYSVRFEGAGGTGSWQGVVQLSPAPPPSARWLDLVADQTRRLIRLDLTAAAEPVQAGIEAGQRVGAAERLLAAEAERIIASAWTTRRAPRPEAGEITGVLTDAGALAADSRTPGQLAALCLQLGVTDHGIRAAPAAELPGPWASVVAQYQARSGAASRELFAPLAAILPEIDGTRFALAGLSSAGGECYVHVAASGLPGQRRPFEDGWRAGFSWWLKDSAGHWHVAVPRYPLTRRTGHVVLELRLTPPLGPRPDPAEVVLTGASGRLRAVVAVHDGRDEVRGGPGLPAQGGH